MNRRILVVKLLFLFIIFNSVSSFAFLNFGVGYTFGNGNNWLFRIGYESDMFTTNADYLINVSWNINVALFFNTQISLYIGPMINILNKFAVSNTVITYGPAFGLKYNQLEAKIGILSDFKQGFQLSNFSENLYTQFRYYVPDPPGMKMRDKFYVEIRYFSSYISVLFGLLEP